MIDIVLIGMPGSGKSTIGQKTAKQLNMEFLDTDALIERSEKRPITSIFKSEGEGYFRTVETAAIEAVANALSSCPAGERGNNGLLLSVGGGAAENPANVTLFKKIGCVIFIDRPFEALEKNISYNGKRPLLSDREKLVELYERRTPLYRSIADKVIVNDRDFDSTVGKLSLAARLMGADTDFLLIGEPVAHSLSPQLHARIYDAIARAAPDVEAQGLKYGAARVTPDGLTDAVRDIRSGGVRGFNVTIPHKKTVIPYLDELRGDAAAAGAVNTVVKEGSRLIGYNTDMEGLRLAIRDMGKAYSGANISVLGTGGAAAGACVKAALEGAAAVRVIGRNARAADEILRAAESDAKSAAGSAHAGDANTVFEFLEYDFALCCAAPAGFADALAGTDILINATPLGMSGGGAVFADFEFLDELPDDAIVYDIVYNPEDTELTKAAKSRGVEACSGLSMLIYQGILADILFLGAELDPHELFESVKSSFSPVPVNQG